MKLTLGKCWQTTRGALVFQCSSHDGESRRKGYLVLDPVKSQESVYFTEEKPADIAPTGGISMLVRKFLSAATVSGIAVHSLRDPKGFISKEYLRLWLQGKTSNGESSEIWIVVATKPQKEINIIRSNQSIARLHQDAQYTMAKPLPEAFLDEEMNVPEEGFQAWLEQILISENSSPKPQSKINTHDVINQPTSIESNLPQTVSALHKSARDRIARRLKTLKKTFAQDHSKLPTPEEVASAKRDAELLRNYLWLVKPEAVELKLDAAQTGDHPRVIALDPELSAGSNLERIFSRVKKLEKAILLGLPRSQNLEKHIKLFESALDQLRQPQSSPTDREVTVLLQQLGLERDSQKISAPPIGRLQKQTPGRRFLATSGALIILGRTAQESDVVVKAARSQDWWLHIAGGSHGSHVIVTGSSVKNDLPVQDQRDAGILALHFSDRGQSQEGEVYVCRRHQIKKRKGMAPGLWQIDRAETAVIRYTSEELASLFAREIRDGQQRHSPSTN